MKNNKKQKTLFHFVVRLIVGIFIAQNIFLLSAAKPPPVQNAALTSASATLSNSRLSYYAQVASNTSAGESSITIETTGNADNSTNHLFPNDTVSVGPNGNITVATITDSSSFVLDTPLTVGASANDAVYATQSGSLTVSFNTSSQIPANGDIIVTIPAPSSGGNDGAPDTAASTSSNGFDLNGVATTDVTCSGTGGTNNGTWSTTSVTAGSGSSDHTIVCTTTSAVDASVTITMAIDSNPGIVNPAPVTSGHTQGAADVYSISAATRDSSDVTIDSITTKVAPIEAVLVSATIDPSLSVQVAGVSSSQTACNLTTDVTTTAYSVPFGTIANTNAFVDGAQTITVSTNAPNGYVVKVEENDQMGKEGKTCTGASAGESANCVPDTTCDSGPCTESTGADWNTATNNGFGYSLNNSSGTDAAFLYSDSSSTFFAKQIADQEASETIQTIMSNTGAVSGSAIQVCYRLSVSGTQPAGYYYNKIKYTATPTF